MSHPNDDSDPQHRQGPAENQGIALVAPAAQDSKPRRLFSFWFTASVQFATLAAGALTTAILGLSFGYALLAFAIGSAIGSLMLGLLSTAGPRIGAPQMVQSRGALGFVGNYIPAVLFLITVIGWFAVTTLLGVFVLQTLLDVPLEITVIILAAVQLFIAVVGFRLMERLQRFLSYLMMVVFAVVTVYTFSTVDLGVAVRGPAAEVLGIGGAMGLAIAISASRLLSFAGTSSDYSRYLPKDTPPRRVFLNVFLGAFLASVWIGGIGAALGLVTVIGTPSDLVAGVLPEVLAVVILIALFCSTASSSTIDVYSASLSLLTMDLKVPQWVTALIVGIVGAIAAVLAGAGDYYGQFESFLIFLGYWLGPWVAIMAVHLLFVPRTREYAETLYRKDPPVRGGLAAFLIGLAVSVPFMNSGIYTGPIAAARPDLGDLTAFVGGITAALAYVIIMLVGRRSVVSGSSGPAEPEAIADPAPEMKG